MGLDCFYCLSGFRVVFVLSVLVQFCRLWSLLQFSGTPRSYQWGLLSTASNSPFERWTAQLVSLSSIPGQDTHPGCGLKPQWGLCRRQQASVCLSPFSSLSKINKNVCFFKKKDELLSSGDMICTALREAIVVYGVFCGSCLHFFNHQSFVFYFVFFLLLRLILWRAWNGYPTSRT